MATAFTYRLHPVQTVTGGLIAHPLDAAPELLRFYRDAIADASDDLTVFAGLVHAPDGSGAKLAALVVFHAGAPDEAERELAPFKRFGSPLVVQVGRMPYPQMNTLLDAGYPDGALNYWLSSFTDGLSDELIGTAVERFATVPSTLSSILFEHFTGRSRGSKRRTPPSRTASPDGTSSSHPCGPIPPPPTPTSTGRARRSPPWHPGSLSVGGSATSATTKPTTPSAPPTAPTTNGSATSSAATTPTTFQCV